MRTQKKRHPKKRNGFGSHFIWLIFNWNLKSNSIRRFLWSIFCFCFFLVSALEMFPTCVIRHVNKISIFRKSRQKRSQIITKIVSIVIIINDRIFIKAFYLSSLFHLWQNREMVVIQLSQSLLQWIWFGMGSDRHIVWIQFNLKWTPFWWSLIPKMCCS